MQNDLRGLAEMVKLAAHKAFGDDEIGNCTYSTIIEEEYDDIDEILDDLRDYHDSNIISITTNKSMFTMQDEDKLKLYQILLHIYKERTAPNIDSFNTVNHSTYYDDKMMDIAVSVTKKMNQTLSLRDQIIIDLNKVMQLFQNEIDLNPFSLLVITSTKFCAKAKKYGIRAAKAKKVLTEMRRYFYDETAKKSAALSMERNESRYEWKIGSKCRIWSVSTDKWCDGEIIKVFNDTEGEWLRVRYAVNDKMSKQKSIQRYNDQIQQVLMLVAENKRRNSVDRDYDSS